VDGLLDKAKGGVLFIDEAYTLGQGSFGSEACDTLVAAMTNPIYAGVVVVIAGYPKDIDNMLRSNAGLKSRFTHVMTFPDWDPSDCVQCFSNRAREKEYGLPDRAVSILQVGFRRLKTLDGFGNARDVDAVWKAASRHRADRIVSMGNLDNSKKSFEEGDIKKALDDMIKSRTSADGKESLCERNVDDQLVLPPLLSDSTPTGNPDDEWEDACAGGRAEDELFDCKEKSETETQGLLEELNAVQEVEDQSNGRDLGVTDAVWSELQQAKEAEDRYAEQCRAEEKERKRVQAELEAQLRAKQLAEDAYRKIMEELQRQRELAAENERKKEMIRQKLQAIGNCPAGFVWRKVGGGWRCAGGSHFVTDAQLKKSFGYDIDT
jgi:hypothetical protein